MTLKILLLAMLATIITLAPAEPIPRLFNNSINSIDKRTSHVKRAPPGDNRCDHGDIWLGRVCDGDRGPQAWNDVCEQPEQDPPGHVVDYNPPGECPENTECHEFDDDDGDGHIRCDEVPHNSDPSSDVTVESKPPQQIGKRKFDSIGNSGTKKQRIVSVEVQQDIPHASVSAHLISLDWKFVISPNKALIGNKRGSNDDRCMEGITHGSHRQCSPVVGRENLKKGDWIDFTFGTLDYQTGYLTYLFHGALS